jgi:hypothetical protein
MDASDPGTTHITLDLSSDLLDALGVAVQVAFDDPDSTPPEYEEAAKILWQFFCSEQVAS